MTPEAEHALIRRGSRAFGPGSRRISGLALVFLAAAAGGSAALVLTRSGSSTVAPPAHAHSSMSPATAPTRSHAHSSTSPATAPTRSHAPAPASSYGKIPSWLPKPKVRVGRTVTASAAHPWLAIEGDAVRVDLAGGRVLVTAVGPAVPEDGRFPVPPTTPCTFTLTFAAAAGVVPLSTTAFTIIDENGHLHHPRVTAVNGGPPPARLTPGQAVSLTVKDVLPTGNGRLRWTPAGARPIVAWDFDVEID